MGMDAFLSGAPAGHYAIVPAMEPLAARVGGTSYQTMTADPAQWCGSLIKAGRLLETDALVLGFEDTLLAEACGAGVIWRDDRPLAGGTLSSPPDAVINGRLETAIEALDRLIKTAGNDFGCVAAMTGPVTLAALLGESDGAELKTITVEVARALCDKRPDLLLFREGPALCERDIGMVQRKAYNTLRNVARYFNIPTAIYVEGFGSQTLASIDRLNLDFYFFGAMAAGELPVPELFLELAERVSGIGLPLPFQDVDAALSHAKCCQETLAGKNISFTTPGELSRDTDLEATRAIRSGLARISRQPVTGLTISK